jgi:HK97 family phage major capsid protein
MKKSIELRQKKANLVNNSRELLDRVEKEGRSLNTEENTQYDRIWKDIEGLNADIERHERQEQQEEELRGAATPPFHQNPNGGAGGENRGASDPRATEEYRAAYSRFLLNGTGALTSDEVRAMQAANDPAGGFMVAPIQFVQALLKNVDDAVIIRQLASKITIATAAGLGIPTLETDVDDADWTAELATGNETNDIGIGKRELRPHPLAKRAKISNKLLRLTSGGIEQLVLQRLSYKFGVAQEKAFMTGDGNQKPLGIFTASNNGISTARDVATGNTATEITFDGLKEAKYTLKGAYWNMARWILHRNAVKQISKIKDDNGQYIWQDSVVDGDPDRVLGFAVSMSEFAPNTFTTGKYVGILGDFSKYQIVDALDMSIQRLVELYALTNQTGYIGRLETDGMPVLEEAFVRVKLG